MKQVDTQLCVLLLVRCNTSGRLKSKAPTTHPHPQRTAVPQQNRGTYSTPARHAPTHHAHLPTMYSSTAAFMHSLLLCRIAIFLVFMIRRHYGNRPSPSPGAPFHALRDRCRLLCVCKCYFSHSLLLCRLSLAGRVPCGVTATLSSVVSEDLAAVAKYRGVPGLRQ